MPREELTEGITLEFIDVSGFKQSHNSKLDTNRFIVDGSYQAKSEEGEGITFELSIAYLDNVNDVDAEIRISRATNEKNTEQIAKFFPNDESIKACKRFIQTLPIKK